MERRTPEFWRGEVGVLGGRCSTAGIFIEGLPISHQLLGPGKPPQLEFWKVSVLSLFLWKERKYMWEWTFMCDFIQHIFIECLFCVRSNTRHGRCL
jgi:hypothetical protein